MQSLYSQQRMQLQSQLWPVQRVMSRTARPVHPSYQVHSSSSALSSALHTCKGEQQCACGIVIVDHGSRRKASNDMLLEFCVLYQQITDHAIVEPAHMEIAEPTIAQAICEFAARLLLVTAAPQWVVKHGVVQLCSMSSFL